MDALNAAISIKIPHPYLKGLKRRLAAKNTFPRKLTGIELQVL